MAAVSVIIPSKNSARTIGSCLLSIKNQTFRDVEIIVVDGFSSDGTQALATQHGAQLIEIDGERTKAKNHALRQSSSNYVMFVDADMVLEPGVIEECVNVCKSGKVGVVIPERSVGRGIWVRIRDFERSFYEGTKIESARFFVRENALEVGGFDEDIVFYEEATLPQKLEKRGYRIDGRTKSCILHNEDGFDLRKWLRKKQYYGDSAAKYVAKYDAPQLSLSYRVRVFTRQWKRLLRYPLPSSGLVILKTLEYIYAKRA